MKKSNYQLMCLVATGILIGGNVPAASMVRTEAAVMSQKDFSEETVSGIPVKKANKEQYSATYLNIREDATTDSDVVKVLHTGEKVHVTGICENDWARVEYGNKETGYVDREYLVNEDRIEKTPSGVVVVKATQHLYTRGGVKIYSDCKENSEILGTLDDGEEVEATGICANDWIRIKYKKSMGYVDGDYLMLPDTEEETSDTEVSDTEDNSRNIYDSFYSQNDTDNVQSYSPFGYHEDGTPITLEEHREECAELREETTRHYIEWLEANGVDYDPEAVYGRHEDGTPVTYDEFYSQNGPSDDWDGEYEQQSEENGDKDDSDSPSENEISNNTD